MAISRKRKKTEAIELNKNGHESRHGLIKYSLTSRIFVLNIVASFCATRSRG